MKGWAQVELMMGTGGRDGLIGWINRWLFFGIEKCSSDFLRDIMNVMNGRPMRNGET